MSGCTLWPTHINQRIMPVSNVKCLEELESMDDVLGSTVNTYISKDSITVVLGFNSYMITFTDVKENTGKDIDVWEIHQTEIKRGYLPIVSIINKPNGKFLTITTSTEVGGEFKCVTNILFHTPPIKSYVRY